MPTIRKATVSDIDAVTEILEFTIKDFTARKINMWQKGYPNRDSIAADVSNGVAYVVDDNGEVAGYMAIVDGPEEFQSTIDTHWDGKVCTVMHRLLVAPSKRHSGIGSMMMGYWEDHSREKGCDSIRTETDETNLPMRALMSSCGISEVGVLKFDNSDKLAFEKLL